MFSVHFGTSSRKNWYTLSVNTKGTFLVHSGTSSEGTGTLLELTLSLLARSQFILVHLQERTSTLLALTLKAHS